MTDPISEVVITAPNADWLAQFAHELVEERLCAGAHNIAAIRSVYRWEDSIHDRAEARVALRTRTDLVPQIVARANLRHPYEVPCVVALPIVAGNPHTFNGYLMKPILSATRSRARRPLGVTTVTPATTLTLSNARSSWHTPEVAGGRGLKKHPSGWMTAEIAAREALERRARRRHCWVRNVPRWPGMWPGLLLDWRRSPQGRWQGLVAVAVEDERGAQCVQLWMDASDLRAASSDQGG